MAKTTTATTITITTTTTPTCSLLSFRCSETHFHISLKHFCKSMFILNNNSSSSTTEISSSACNYEDLENDSDPLELTANDIKDLDKYIHHPDYNSVLETQLEDIKLQELFIPIKNGKCFFLVFFFLFFEKYFLFV